MENEIRNLETPCFVIDLENLNYNINNINIGRSIFDKSVIGYSVKTNSLSWLLKYFMENTDFYLEVVSPEEYVYVIKLGINPQKIIFNGPCKNKYTLDYSLKNGSIVNIDTNMDVNNIINNDFETNIGIRVNVTNGNNNTNVEKFGYEESRFGFSYDNGDLYRIIKYLGKNKKIKIRGLHFHLNNKKREIGNYIVISKIASEIINEYNLKLDYIDFGGGYKGGVSTNFIDYTSAIYNNLSFDSKDDITYIFEPGAALIATPISYITRVIDVREINEKKYVLVDGGRTHIDPTMSNKRYRYNILNQNNGIENQVQIITGFSCMENDRLLKLVNEQRLSVGDIIKFNNLGAYTMTLMPCFIKGYPNVYLFANEEFTKIRECQSVSDILGGNNGRVYKKIK